VHCFPCLYHQKVFHTMSPKIHIVAVRSPESLNAVLTGKTRVAGGEMAEGGTGRWSNGHYGIR
jgi:hypothetical protein